MLDYCLDISKDSRWLMVPESETARAFPFRMTELGDFDSGKDYYVKRDSRSGYQLIYTVSGTGIFQAQDQEILLSPGSALLIYCQPQHRYAARNIRWHNLWIHFEGPGADSYAEFLEPNTPYAFGQVLNQKQFYADFTALSELASGNSLHHAAHISNYLSDLLTLLLTDWISAPLVLNDSSRQTDIARAAELIRQHFQESLSLDTMADAARLSRYYFVRQFKKQMGETPYAYLTGCRISRAKLLLRSTEDSLDDIAEEVGYSSKSNFIAQFKRLTGTTPNRYRQESLRLLPQESSHRSSILQKN
ncbi:AraC family transcriptional regulator [Ructibacterium gallinarum]|uniref:AraC family transcriptional regulator n=1 Tax=Ructibacterium gallinarum TaxID=2779355 RepID=A0A9D5M3P6_9FIRM|nr:AraC family transcriptional regulator [Ructibacterium gallinarum]MBE5040040.1 AraC family transcriptional regulator [Ructibacterium gallinarum]